MNQTIFLVFVLFATNLAFAEPNLCSEVQNGKTSCIAGEKMECVKAFDTQTKAIKFEWRPVNSVGQSFLPTVPMYKKVEGFTPAKCTS